MSWCHNNVRIVTFKQMEIFLSLFKAQSPHSSLTFGFLIFDMEIPDTMGLMSLSTSSFLWWFLFFNKKNVIEAHCVYLYP